MRASIIISTYSISKLKYIIKTIEKCAENDVEFIITVERDKKYFDTLMDKLKKLKKRINLSAKLILHERRLNLSQARNLGMNFSSGDILIFLDDDVVPANDCIREIIKTFKERDDAAIVGSRVELSIPRNIIFPKIFYTLLGGQYVPPNEQKILRIRNAVGCALSIKKKIIDEIGGFCNFLSFSKSLGAFYGNIGGEDVEISKRVWIHYKGHKKVYLNKRALVYHIISREKMHPWNIFKRSFFLLMIDSIVNDTLQILCPENKIACAQEILNLLEARQLKAALGELRNTVSLSPKNILELSIAFLLFLIAQTGNLLYKTLLKRKFLELIRRNKKYAYNTSFLLKWAKISKITTI